MAGKPHRRRRRFWTDAEVAKLRALYPGTPTWKLARRFRRPMSYVYAKAAKLGLHKSAAYLASPDAFRFRRGYHMGWEHRFKPGHVPANKGLRRPGWGPGRMKETQFKKGQISSRWDPEIYCIGGLRINADGGLDIKLHGGLRAWYSMARWVWETEHGQIPRGMVMRFKNGDTHDTRIENLRLGTRREVMLENTLHNYPKPIAQIIQLRGAPNRQINKREEHSAENA